MASAWSAAASLAGGSFSALMVTVPTSWTSPQAADSNRIFICRVPAAAGFTSRPNIPGRDGESARKDSTAPVRRSELDRNPALGQGLEALKLGQMDGEPGDFPRHKGRILEEELRFGRPARGRNGGRLGRGRAGGLGSPAGRQDQNSQDDHPVFSHFTTSSPTMRFKSISACLAAQAKPTACRREARASRLESKSSRIPLSPSS